METQDNQFIDQEIESTSIVDDELSFDDNIYEFEIPKGESSYSQSVTVDDSYNLGDWISDKLELPNGVIKVDVGDGVVERNVYELSPKQQIAIINHYIDSIQQSESNQSTYNLTPEKQLILDYLDQGEQGLRYLKEELDKELGSSDLYNISDDELIIAKLKSDFEFLSEDELEEEISKFKDDPYYDSKMESLRNKYYQQVEQFREQEELNEYNQLASKVEELQQKYVDIARSTELVGDDVIDGGFFTLDFEDPEDRQLINDTLADLIESDDPNDPTPRYIKYLQDPENIYKTALMQKALPKIQKLVQDLITENEELKKVAPRTIIGDVNSPEARRNQRNFELDVLDEFTELKPLI